MKLTPEAIYGFAGSVLSPRFKDTVSTPKCHVEWWRYCCSDSALVAIAAPRGHAKSTAITHCYTLATVLFKERRFVLLVSDTYEQAVLFLQDIADELRNNDDLLGIFGKMKFTKDSENDIIVRLADGHTFRIIAKGSEQKVRGLKWQNMRPDLIVCDDLENDEIVLNKERREKFRHWFFSALLPCRSRHGIVRIVGTILHMDSLLERLMPKPWDKKYVIDDGLRTYWKEKKFGWYSIKYKAHNMDFSQILWQQMWPKKRLLEERVRFVDQGMPEKYAQEFLNVPIDDSIAYFRAGDFLPMSEEDRAKNMAYYCAMDPAITKDDRADYTALVVGGVDDTGTLHIVDVFRERLDSREIVELLFTVQERYNPEIITVEGGVIQKSIGPYLQAEMMKPHNPVLPIQVITPSKDKEWRARSIQARLRAGKVRFDKEAEWYPELESEMRLFPRAANDDQVDAMAYLGLTLNKMVDAATEQELEEEEYDVAFKLSRQPTGRSQLTGY